MIYRVVVGNIGQVYQGSNEQDALSTFNVYVEQSKNNYGLAAGENVTLFEDNESKNEYIGTRDIFERPDDWDGSEPLT